MSQMAKCVSGAHKLIHTFTLLFSVVLLSISGSTVHAHTTDLSPDPSSRGQADTRVEVRAATRVTWKGGTDSRWSNPANWDGGMVPGPFDIVHLSGSADTQIDAAFSEAVAGIVLEPDFGGTVRLARDLRVRGHLVIEGGTFVQGDHALTTVGWTQTNGQFVGGSAPLTITDAALVRGGALVTPSALMRVRSLELQSPGVVRLGDNGKLELTGEGTPLVGDGVLDTTTHVPNSVESTGRATTDLLAAGPLRGYGAFRSDKASYPLPAAESAALSIPSAATGVALTLAAGEDDLRSAVMDATGTFAYFGTSTNPGIVIKVRLSDFARVGALKLASGENDLHTAVIDAANGFAYFGAYTSPGIIVKVRLSDFTRVGALKLNAGENLPRAAVVDPANGMAYFGTFTSPGRIIQVRLSDLTRVRALTLNAGDDLLFPAVIDPAAGFAYFGGRTVPAFIVKIRLSDLTRVGRLTMNPGEDSFHTGVIDPAGGYAYFGTYTPTGIVLKVRLSDFTKVGALTLNAGEGNLRSSVLDRANGLVYFGTADVPGIVISVRLSDFTRVGAQTLDPGQDKLRCVVIDPANRFIYFGTGSSPGIVVKLPTVSDGSTPTPTATSTVILTPPATPTNTPASNTPTSTPTATPGGSGGSVTFSPVADAHVNANYPTTNYGTATDLKVDGSPEKRGYLRFDVSGLAGVVTKATLRVYANNSLSAGITAKQVADNSWGETTITYNNAPAASSAMASTGAITAGTWLSLDVTSYVTGNGTYSLALTSTSGTGLSLSLASRESTNKPQLVITTGSAILPTPTNTPTFAPSTATPTNAPTNTPASTPTPTTAPSAGAATNLLANPGFELDANNDGSPDSWSTWSHFTRSNTVVHGGAFGGRFRAANDSDGQIQQRVSNLTAGTTYNFAGWVNIPATTDALTLKLQVAWINSANNTISTVTMQTYSAPTAGWNQTTAALVAPAGTVMADIRLVVSSLNATIYVDGLSFAKAPQLARFAQLSSDRQPI